MRIKKTSNLTKFGIIAIAVILAAIAVFGFSNIQAEPTIEDLAAPYVQQMGSFNPNHLYDDETSNSENMRLVSWLNTTQIIFECDLWGTKEDDVDGDGKFDSQDVYLTEGFEQGMLMYTGIYPVFEVSEKDDYYIVPLSELNRYNGVVIDLVIAENNDLANLTKENKYWFDNEKGLLYIARDVLDPSIAEEVFNSLRAETIMLVKDTADMTKTIDLFAMFNEGVKDWHGLNKKVVNETRDVNVLNWSVSGLKYKLVDDSMLAYVSSDNLKVYYNYVEMPNTEWSYNELTGELTIDCDVAKTTSIVVEFTKINDVSLASSMLQYCQIDSGDEMVKADSVSIMDALKSNNQFLDYLQYDEKAPEVGDWQELGYFCYVVIDESGGFTGDAAADIKRMKDGIKQYAFNSQVPKDTVAEEVYHWAKNVVAKGEYTQSATLSAYSNGYSWDYGYVVTEMFHASQGGVGNLENALNRAESKLFTNVNKDGDDLWGNALTNLWMMSEADKSGNADEGRYVTGVASDTLLNGAVPENSNAMFDVICARIIAPNAEAVKDMEDEFGDYSSKSETDFRSNITIIAKTEEKVLAGDGTEANGYLYLCLWAQSVSESTSHHQRVLAFSRVPYKYHGTGYISLTKYGPDGQVVSGAKYSIQKVEKDGTLTTVPGQEYITTGTVAQKTGELPMGTYQLKEVSSPEGYLLNPQTYTVTVESGKTTVLGAEQGFVDQYQMCDFTMTVYDATTKGKSKEVPVAGIKFQLYSTERGLLEEYTTDKNGQITGAVKTIVTGSTESYYLKQINTVSNYAITKDPDSWLYCYKIPISAPATNSGKNTSTSIKHYEARQEIDLMSQVQDINLGAKTPATLGGSSSGGSLVTTLGAKYNLKTKSEILLGYDNKGNPIKVSAGTVLNIETYTTQGTQDGSTKAQSVESNGKAYIYAMKVNYNGVQYPVPNGEYEWVLTDASSGYYMNGQTTYIDAKWYSDNWEETKLKVHDTPVQQIRQTAKLSLIVKYYDDDSRNTTGSNISAGNTTNNATFITVIRNKVPSLSQVLGDQYKNLYKSIYTKDTSLTKTSVDKAIGYNQNEEILIVEAEDLAANSVYALYNIHDIIDIDTGEVIAGLDTSKNAQPLGFYLTNSNNEIIIETLGTNEFANPVESVDGIDKIKRCDPKTTQGTSTFGHAVPNGEYYLVPYYVADEFYEEKILAEETSHDDVKWNKSKELQLQVSSTCATYLWKQGVHPEVEPIVAPDAPIDNTNPVNPPIDDVGVWPDGTIVDNEWVDENADNIAYRIFDSVNLDGEKYEVVDELPTSFAFYLNNDTVKDPLYNYTYHLSVFYEVSEAEYKTLAASERYSWDGVHYRRFDTNNMTEADKLSDVIKFNSAMFDGYISDTEILDNETIAGMIYNTDWLNEKMREQEEKDGTLKILFQVKISYSYNSKFSGDPIQINKPRPYNGVLTIKNRQLVNLD